MSSEFYDLNRFVEAKRFVGTEASAKAVIKWLGDNMQGWTGEYQVAYEPEIKLKSGRQVIIVGKGDFVIKMSDSFFALTHTQFDEIFKQAPVL